MIQKRNYSIFSNVKDIRAVSAWMTEDPDQPLEGWQQVWENILPELKPLNWHPEKIAFAGQIHSNIVKQVRNPGRAEKCDGMVTAQAGLSLAIRTADCSAVMIYDPDKQVLLNLHAGWRGVQNEIILEGIRCMNKKYNSKPAELIVAVSPFIQACCMEVGSEFYDYFPSEFIEKRDGNFYFDMRSVIKKQLTGEGIPESRIEISKECTKCHPDDFPSYRRNKTLNRMISLIKIEE